MKNDLRSFNTKIRQDLTLQTTQNGHPMTLKTTWGLFSPRAIDEGSQLLLKHLEIAPDDDCLDLGCGYGILGLTMVFAVCQAPLMQRHHLPENATAEGGPDGGSGTG